MAELLDGARLYLRLIRARLRSQLQYRVSFTLDLVGLFLITALDFAAILIIFANVPALATWTVWEVAVLYGIAGIAFGIADLVVGHLDLFPQTIRDGSFDLVLVRPRSTLFMVLTADFQLRRLGRIAQAALVLVLALANLGLAPTPERLAVMTMAVISGCVIFIAVWVAIICIAFWAVEARETANAFTNGGVTLAQYPIEIYDPWLRRFLAYVVPMAFVAYFPTLVILGRSDPFGFPAWLAFAPPLVAAAAWAVAANVWTFAVRRYRSAGG